MGWTIAVQKALSCVYRTGQMFGVGLVDVLRGNLTAHVKMATRYLKYFAIGWITRKPGGQYVNWSHWDY
jgi:hypothetical protein